MVGTLAAPWAVTQSKCDTDEMRILGITPALVACSVVALSCGADGSTAAERRQVPGATVTIAPVPTAAPPTTTASAPADPHALDGWEVYFEIPERDLRITSRGFQPRIEIGYAVREDLPFRQQLVEVQNFDGAIDGNYTETVELEGRVAPRDGGLVIELDAAGPDDQPAALSLLADNDAAVLTTGEDLDVDTVARFDATIAALIPLPQEPVGMGARWFTHTNLFDASSIPGTFEVLAIEPGRLTLSVSGNIRDNDTAPGAGFSIEATISGTLEIDLTTAQVDGSVIVVGTGTSIDQTTNSFVQSLTFESG